jgi:hypothetical protein
MGFSLFLKLTQHQLPIFMPDSQECQITGFQTIGHLLYFTLFNLQNTSICDSIYQKYIIAKCMEEGQGRGMMPGWTYKSDVKGLWRKRRKEKKI